MVIPKPLCQCRVCREARRKGIPYSRSGPSAFMHDINLLIDMPAEIADQLNQSNINHIDYALFTHLDPDHVEGFRVVEQISLDFRTWRAYPGKQICLIMPEQLYEQARSINSQYGSVIDFYQESDFIKVKLFQEKIHLNDVSITAIPIDRGSQISFVYIFEKSEKKVVYAPCDLKPFPEHRNEVRQADLLIIQPGIFETGLKHSFKYPPNHISRSTLYTFEQTLDLAFRIQSKKVLFVHLEEYWNRSYDDYRLLEAKNRIIEFAYDGMLITI